MVISQKNDIGTTIPNTKTKRLELQFEQYVHNPHFEISKETLHQDPLFL